MAQSASSIRTITDYRILPEKGGGIAVDGILDGKPWRTTSIVSYRKGEVMTRSGSHYRLSNMRPGMWVIQLNLQRPEQYAKLTSVGLV
jgi:hypothetical protein